MLLWLSEYLVHFHTGFNVFQYITMRAILGALTSLFIALLVGTSLIRSLSGLLILISIAFSTLCWADLTNRFIWVVFLVTMLFGVVGWVDDYRKIVRQDPVGLAPRWKYFWQSLIGLSAAWFLFTTAQVPNETRLIVPFIKSVNADMGWSFIVLAYFVIVGSSNAVNLTDGLDGLAILPSVMVAGALAIFAYVTGHVNFAQYLGIPYIPGVGEVSVICGAIVGSGLGFLWFNTYPAQVFMGDIGALSLGAALGIIAIVVRQELVLFIMGGVFVVETISVILQVGSFKLTGRRIFHMAPLHHHYELKGWPEPRVIVRFWIITFILVLVGLSSLKIR